MIKRLLVAIIAAIAIAAAASLTLASDGMKIRLDGQSCVPGGGFYKFDVTLQNLRGVPGKVTSYATHPGGGEPTYGIFPATIDANATVPGSFIAPNQPTGEAQVFVTIEWDDGITASDRNGRGISGHCPADPTPTPTSTTEPTATPTDQPTLTATVTASITPTGTVTPGETVIPTVTPTNTATMSPSSTPSVETPVQDPGQSATPQVSLTPCPETGCLLPDCEWVKLAQNLVIHSGGHNNLFSREDIEGEDVHIDGYDIVFDVEYSSIESMVEGEITTTSAQCSVCPEAPLVFEIDGAWFGIYMTNLSNIANLTVAFQAKGVDFETAREWAQNIANQFNDPAVGNYRSGVYPAIPVKTIK
jgi:hypothetical protein